MPKVAIFWHPCMLGTPLQIFLQSKLVKNPNRYKNRFDVKEHYFKKVYHELFEGILRKKQEKKRKVRNKKNKQKETREKMEG